MTEYRTYEHDGWFYAFQEAGSYSPFPADGSLGTGSSMTVVRFQSAEARSYYIRAQQAEERARSTEYQYECLLKNVIQISKRRRGFKRKLEELLKGRDG